MSMLVRLIARRPAGRIACLAIAAPVTFGWAAVRLPASASRSVPAAAAAAATAAPLLQVAGSHPAPAPGAAAGLPPLIDRELFFGDPEIIGAQISPDGRFIAFLKPFGGTRNIWVKRVEETFDQARPLTGDTKRPISAYFWSRDAKFILYVQDAGGDENFNVYAVRPSDPPAEGTQVPAARNITDLKGVRALIYEVPRSDPDLIYVGLNDRDKAWHDLYQVRISTGERTLLRKNTERIAGWTFDVKDRLRLATRAAENGDTEVLRVDETGLTKIYSCTVFEQCDPMRFHKDGRRVYLSTNKAGDLVRLALLDVQSGREEPVESDPLHRVDLAAARFSDRTDDLIATAYIDDRPRLSWKDKAFEGDYHLLQQRLPGRDIAFASQSHTTEERLYMVVATADTDPGSTYLFDRQTKQLTLQYRIREKLPRESLASMTAVRYKSSDGLEIPAYLTLPKGVEARRLPLVVLPHGGPWARDVWGYLSLVQFLANRGYAVLQPNFRGSTGYGRKFLDAGNKEWGGLMQDDLTWGVKHLVSQGIADEKRVGIMGGSYGGYATLAGVTFTPDLYAAAVSIVGPSNLITLLASVPPYWEAGRKMFLERMGDPSTPEGKARLESQSPLNSAGRIKTPLLIIQGANDPRVKKAESEQIVIALRERGFPVEYLLAPDEGHGFLRPVNNMAAFAAAEKFFAAHLHARGQETMTAEVAERLKVLTVDPESVEKPKPVATPAEAPRPAADLHAGVSTYQTRLEMGGQKMDMAFTTEIKEDQGAWVVIDTAKGAMGEGTDRAILSKGTLLLRKRSVSQGPVSIDFEVKDGKAAGEMRTAGQARPIDVDLGGDLFADGPGSSEVIAALPLANGYTTSFRNFDLRTQQVKNVQLRVAGTEQVTVPAGTFDTFKVEVNATDGMKSTLWVATDTRRPVKRIMTVPALNGAAVTVTAELQKSP